MAAEEGCNDEDLEEGELLDDGEVDYSDEKLQEESVATVAGAESPPAVIPSLLDMKISPPRNGKTFDLCTELNAVSR